MTEKNIVYVVKENLTFSKENDYIEAGRMVSADDLHGKAEALLARGLIEEVKPFAIEADAEQTEETE
jgi:hypothetical protein